MRTASKLIVFIVALGFIGFCALSILSLSGCATCNPDCKEMNYDQCRDLRESCAQVARLDDKMLSATECSQNYPCGKDPQSR